MADVTMRLVHKCGEIVNQGDERCSRCGQPLMPPLPDWLLDGAKQVEHATGLDRLRVSLLGVVATAYLAGWDAAVAAFTAPEAEGGGGADDDVRTTPPEEDDRG